MKSTKLLLFAFALSFVHAKVSGQSNASINLLTQNSGVVNQGGSVFVQVTVNSTGPTTGISTYRVRTQISVPAGIVSVSPNAQQTGLPAGWTIVSNIGSAITVCNATDAIPVGQSRTILIAVQGNTIGGPSPVSGTLTFGNGNATNGCTTLTGSLAGDNTGDNSSSSSITVTSSLPVTLTDFNAKLINCQPELHWTTEGEINSEAYEIERSYLNTSNWSSIGRIAANGASTTKVDYSFSDRNSNVLSDQVLYRLKMIDKDGDYKYSSTLRVYINCTTTKAYVYPNPVQDGKLYISLTGSEKSTEASLLTLSGQTITTHKLTTGTNQLNVSSLANGVYVLSIKDANGYNKKIKVLIQR